MTDNHTIRGSEGATAYIDGLSVGKAESARLQHRAPAIEEALNNSEEGIARLSELCRGLPEEFTQKVHEAAVALRAVRSYKERFTR